MSIAPDAVVSQANETDGLGYLISRKKREAEKENGENKTREFRKLAEKV